MNKGTNDRFADENAKQCQYRQTSLRSSGGNLNSLVRTFDAIFEVGENFKYYLLFIARNVKKGATWHFLIVSTSKLFRDVLRAV